MQNSSNETGSFWKKIVLTLVFFTFTPVTLFASVLALTAIYDSEIDTKYTHTNLIEVPKPGIQVYASLPDSLPSISGEVTAEDARSEIIREYLDAYNSPLTSYAGFIVQTADKYGLDFRLLTAIAQKESGLCRVIPEGSNNCWGWGIHSEGTLGFDSYEEAIETVSKGLKENYIDLGYVSVEEIMAKYAHPSSTTWAEGVSFYMNQMR